LSDWNASLSLTEGEAAPAMISPSTTRRASTRLPSRKRRGWPLRVFIFSPGPAALADRVRNRLATRLLDWHQDGAFRSCRSVNLRQGLHLLRHPSEADLRELMGFAANYQVLFLCRCGARPSSLSSFVPMNLAGADSVRRFHEHLPLVAAAITGFSPLTPTTCRVRVAPTPADSTIACAAEANST